MNPEMLTVAEGGRCSPETVDTILTTINDRVGDLRTGPNGPFPYPGVPSGLFDSSTKDGQSVVLQMLQIPIQMSRRGEVGIVVRSRPGDTMDHRSREKAYYLFNEGDTVTLERFNFEPRPPEMEVPTHTPDGKRLGLIALKKVHILAVQKWYDLRWEDERVKGESRVDETEALDLLGEMQRGRLQPMDL